MVLHEGLKKLMRSQLREGESMVFTLVLANFSSNPSR